MVSHASGSQSLRELELVLTAFRANRDDAGPERAARSKYERCWERTASPASDQSGRHGALTGIGGRRGSLGGGKNGKNHWTTNVPVMIVGWTSHRKKYVPGVLGAVKV